MVGAVTEYSEAEIQEALESLNHRGEQKILVGQVWQEKKQRGDVLRFIRIDKVGEEAYSHQPGHHEITRIEFTDLTAPHIQTRGMYAFGLRKNWVLVENFKIELMDDDRDPETGSLVPCVFCGMAPQRGGTGVCSDGCDEALKGAYPDEPVPPTEEEQRQIDEADAELTRLEEQDRAAQSVFAEERRAKAKEDLHDAYEDFGRV